MTLRNILGDLVDGGQQRMRQGRRRGLEPQRGPRFQRRPRYRADGDGDEALRQVLSRPLEIPAAGGNLGNEG
ncbi:hypothetical protein PG991_016277 [Apiospora marii]|uniref:Uncharacterized protein n=1 Tax=Apiospora marii TaxID=335849 RepID=A0ABR1QZN7_9PEZI